MDLINKTKTYIEVNIEAPIDLDNLAGRAGYSKYHFLRIYKRETGSGPMAYLRARRLVHAAHQLMVSERRVTDIALACGFSNVDTFIRNFKCHYGMTPIQYREINDSNHIEQEEAIPMSEWLQDQLRFNTKEERQGAVTVIHRMMELSDLARKNGLLALEEAVTDLDEAFLLKAVDLVTSGTYPEMIRKILTNYLSLSDISGEQILHRTIIMEGVLSIQQGHNPDTIEALLYSLLGEDYIGHGSTEDEEALLSLVESYLASEPVSSESNAMDKALGSLDQRSMQRLLRECDLVTLAIACEGASRALREKVIKAISKKQYRSFTELPDVVSNPSLPLINSSQQKIIETAQRLRREGEIL